MVGKEKKPGIPLDRRYILPKDIDPKFKESFIEKAPTGLGFPTRNQYAFLTAITDLDPKKDRVVVKTSEEWVIDDRDKNKDGMIVGERPLSQDEIKDFITHAGTIAGNLKRGKNLSIDEAIQLLRRKVYEINPETLERQLGEDGEGSNLADFMRADDDPEGEAIETVFGEDVSDILSYIEDARDRRVLSLRFGFEGRPHTLEETGREIGLTRERVRQLQVRGMRILAANPRVRELFLQYIKDNV